MEHFLKYQINEGCRLAMPEGLKDLMWDISREVLRAQPSDLFVFVSEYLAALLAIRENVSVATRVCAHICDNICHLGLEDELRRQQIQEPDVKLICEVVEKYFAKGHVKECQLLNALIKEIDIDESVLPCILDAIRKAFARHQAQQTKYELSSSESSIDSKERAARHTLNLYKKTGPNEDEYNRAARTIQTAYRAYGVRRALPGDHKKNNNQSRAVETTPHDTDTTGIHFYDRYGRCPFEDAVLRMKDSHEEVMVADNASERTEDVYVAPCRTYHGKLTTLSSTTLAGSHINLPKYRPYSVQETFLEIDELEERENVTIDYTDSEARIKGINRIARRSSSSVTFDDLPAILPECSDADYDNDAEDNDDDSNEPMKVDDEEDKRTPLKLRNQARHVLKQETKSPTNDTTKLRSKQINEDTCDKTDKCIDLRSTGTYNVVSETVTIDNGGNVSDTVVSTEIKTPENETAKNKVGNVSNIIYDSSDAIDEDDDERPWDSTSLLEALAMRGDTVNVGDELPDEDIIYKGNHNVIKTHNSFIKEEVNEVPPNTEGTLTPAEDDDDLEVVDEIDSGNAGDDEDEQMDEVEEDIEISIE